MKKRITITIDPELIKRVKIRGVEEDKKFSTLVEELLLKWINDYDKDLEEYFDDDKRQLQGMS